MVEKAVPFMNALAITGWLLLLIWPKSRLTLVLVRRHTIPMILSAVDLLCVLTSFGSLRIDDFANFATVRAFFANPNFLLAAWVHFLAFDLVIGTWMDDDSRARGIPRLFMWPVLFMCFYIGPIGFLMYQALRWVHELVSPSVRAKRSEANPLQKPSG